MLYKNTKILFMALILLSLPAVGFAQSLEGVWRGVSIQFIGGDEPRTEQFSNMRILIYTESFFMWAFDNATEPRPLLSQNPQNSSDAEIGRVARQYQSTGGTYQLDGNTIIYNRLIDMVPNGMAPENQPFIRNIRMLTANRLETQITNNEGNIVVLRYVRME